MKRKHTLRNLLSMVCVIAMIISMVPVLPAAAADETVGSAQAGGMIDFVDANEIVNTEAVAITAGMGLFAGTTEGKFDPAGTVTRAQMATIIVKMLRGNDFNADNFKGLDKFSDTAAFEGGWAEGYINACVQMGVVAGYGDGTFKPGQAVTTAEALTMIINALKVDAGAGEWPTTIMAKAQEMKLYGDLAVKPGTYDALTRDQLAVLAYEGMCYSPAGVSGYKVPGSDIVFKDIADALKVCADPSLITEVMGEDALATKVYELKTFEGFVTANQATGEDEYTTVTAYNADGSTAPVSVDFNMETGLAQIGHYVTVYYREEYKNDVEPGVVYNYVDETQVVTVEEDITTSKKYKEAFGKSIKEAALLGGGDAVLLFTGNYVTDVNVDNRGSIAGYDEGISAKEGTYLINDGVVKAYMAPIPVFAARVRDVSDFEGNETIELSGVAAPISNSEGNDCVREYEGIAKDDYVTYTVVGTGINAIYVLTKATSVSGVVAKTFTNDDGENVISMDGVDYVEFGGTNNITEFQGQAPLNYTDNYTLFITEDGKYLGWEQTSGGLDLDSTVFILGELTVVVDDGYGGKVRKTTARGVDMNGNEVNLPLKIEKNGTVDENGTFFPSRVAGDNVSDNYAPLTPNTFYTYKLSSDRAAKKENIHVLKAYPDTYDEKNAPLYTVSRTIKSGVAFDFDMWVTGGKNVTTDGPAVYILMEGELNQPTPLTATVSSTWGIAINQTGADMQNHILFARNSNDEQVVRVAVMHVEQNIDAATISYPIYVAETGREPVGMDANGYVYDVYDYKTGEPKQITLKTTDPQLDANGKFTSAGFWHTIPDAAGSVCSVLAGRVPNTFTSATEKVSGSAGNTTNNDQLYYENILHDQQFLEMVQGQFFTTNFRLGKGAAGAQVVDTRTEEDIAAFGIGEITSMSRIETLTQDYDNLVVIFDMCYSTSEKRLLVVFVKNVYYTSQEGGADLKEVGGVCYLDGRAVSDNVTIIDNTNTVLGSTDADKLDDLLSKKAMGNVLNLTYLMSNGKVSSITVGSVLKPGVLFEENFDAYTIGSDYDYTAEGAYLVAHNASNPKGDATFTVVSEGLGGALKMSATGPDGDNRSWLDTSNATFGADGSFILETRLKVNDEGQMSYLVLNNVKVGEKAYELRFLGKSFSAYSNFPGIYAFSTGFATAIGGSNWRKVVKYEENAPVGDWYTLKIYVNKDAGTVLTEVYNDAGTLLGSDAVTNAVVDGGAIGFEALPYTGKTQEFYLDYVVVKEYVLGTTEYSVTVEDTDPNGLIEADVTSAEEGEIVTFTATAKSGYKLDKLLVNDVDILTGNDLSTVVETEYTMPAANITVKAEFAPISSYAVSIADYEGGTVTVTANGAPVANGDQVVEGTVLTITATPSAEYKYENIFVDGTPIEGNTIVMPDKAIAITVDFEVILQNHNVTVGGQVNGTVALSSSGSVLHGTEITVTATPAAGYVCKAICVNGEKIDGTSFTLEDDSLVTAVFWPEDALIHDGFDSYVIGSDYDYTAEGSPFVARSATNPTGNSTFEIVSEGNGGALKVSCSGTDSTDRSWLDASDKTTIGSNGSFMVEARFKTNTKGQYTYIRMNGVTFAGKNFQLRFMGEEFSNYSYFPGIYNYSDGFATAIGGSNWRKVVKYADDNAPAGEWYIVKIYVNKDAGTVCTELWDGDGTTMLGTDTATNAVVAGGTIGFENVPKSSSTTRETYWDYFTIKSWTPASN